MTLDKDVVYQTWTANNLWGAVKVGTDLVGTYDVIILSSCYWVRTFLTENQLEFVPEVLFVLSKFVIIVAICNSYLNF